MLATTCHWESVRPVRGRMGSSLAGLFDADKAKAEIAEAHEALFLGCGHESGEGRLHGEAIIVQGGPVGNVGWSDQVAGGDEERIGERRDRRTGSGSRT